MANEIKHIAKKGETISQIAEQYRIRYWRNLYFAKDNIRYKRQPQPGDVVYIPDQTSITLMENNPKIIHRDIPLYLQSENTCWKATGLMLYERKHPGQDAKSRFFTIIGNHYKNREKGLFGNDWYKFYCVLLGMKEAVISCYNDLHYIIARYGPAIISTSGSYPHSYVMAGYDVFQGEWLLLNPAAIVHYEFSPSASGTIRPGTWELMSQWINTTDKKVFQKVYYYG